MLSGEQEVSSLLGLLYDAAAEPDLWTSFLQALAQATGAESAGLVMIDWDQRLFGVSRSWNLDPVGIQKYEEYYGSVDIWTRRGLSKPRSAVCNSEMLCPEPELRRSEFYNDFLAPLGIQHGLFCSVEKNPNRWASISLYRGSRSQAFQVQEDRVVELLAPHMRRAFRLHLAFSQMKAHSATVDAALERLHTSVIFLGTAGEVLVMNTSAERLLRERDGLITIHARLRAAIPAESELLVKTIHETAATSNGCGCSAGQAVFISRRNRPPLHVLVAPIHASTFDPFRKIAVVVYITDPLRRQRPPEALLRGLYGLTPAECRIALLSGDGHAPRQISTMVGVTENTVRSQIKSIYSKTGVKRQGELIRLLLNHAGTI